MPVLAGYCVFSGMDLRFFLKRYYPVLLGALLLQACFFALALHYKSLYLTDSQEYFYQAENLKNHGSLYAWKWQKPFILQMWTLRTPVYGYLIYLIQQVSSSHFAILLFQNLLAFVNFAGLVWLLRNTRLPARLLQGLLLMALLFFPTRLVYTNMVMSELVLETCLFWAFFCLLHYQQSTVARWLLGYNLLLALAVLTKPVLVYFWVPNLLLMGFLAVKNRQPVLWLQSLIMPATIAALCFYNLQVTGYFHYSSIKTYNLYDYNTKGLLANLYDSEYANRVIKEMIKTDQDFAGLKERSEYLETESFKIIKQHAGYYLWLHFRGTVNFFLDPGRYDLVNFLPPLQSKTEFSFFGTLKEHGAAGIGVYLAKVPLGLTVYMALIFGFNLVISLAFAAWVFLSRRNVVLRIFAGLLVAYMAAAPGPIGCARFKEPVWFLLINGTVWLAGHAYETKGLRFPKIR